MKTNGQKGRFRCNWFLAGVSALALIQAAPAAGLSDAAAAAVKPEALAQARKTYSFDIPAKPLPQAIAEFSAITGVQVLYTETATFDHTAPALKGSFAARDALRMLLAGSGLIPRYTSANAVTIEQPGASAGGDGTIHLDPVQVEGARPATTEGTGSFTTSEMSTATKLPLSIRETPQSVTVITRQRMDDQGMTNITDAAQNTPGLFVGNADGPGRPLIYSRGFYVGNVTLDGAATAFSSYIPSALSNLAMYDRVEVVRGATGLVQGAGNPSASVNLVRKRPTRDFQAAIDLSAGSWENFGGIVDLGGPLTDGGGVRARVVGSIQDTDSFRDLEEHNRKLVYGITEADLGKRTTLTVGAYHQRDNTDGGWWGGLPISETGQHLGLPRSTTLANDWEYLDQKATAVFGELEYRFDSGWNAEFTALNQWMDVDGIGTYIYTDVSSGIDRQHWTWRADRETISSNYDLFVTGPVQLFDRTHELVFGASHASTDDTTTNFNTAYIDNNFDVFNWDPYSLPKPDLPFQNTAHTVTTQNSGYATARVSVFDPLKLILGGRLDWYDFNNRSAPTGDYSVNANLTKYAGLIFDIDAHHSVYTSYTDIFSPQSNVDVNGNTLEPVVGENYEFGIKGEYFGGALNANVAVFQIDQTNRASQVDDVSLCTTASTCYQASGLVRSRGIETEIQGAILENWQIGAGYSYTKTEYIDDASNAPGTPFDTRLPQHLFKFATVYTLPGALRRWRVGGSVYWQSGIYADGSTNGVSWRNKQDAYAIANLILGFKPTDSLDLQLNVNNLFDTTYYRSIGYSTSWGSTDVYGDPRNFQLSARYRF